MENIFVITLNSDNNQVETRTTVDELIHSWYHNIDIPSNDDPVVSCLIGKTQLYVETFGNLMQILTGEC